MSNYWLVVYPLNELAHIAPRFETRSFNKPSFSHLLSSTLHWVVAAHSQLLVLYGKGMYSQLYLDVLNRYPRVQNATTYRHAYNDCGLFCIYGSSVPPDVWLIYTTTFDVDMSVFVFLVHTTCLIAQIHRNIWRSEYCVYACIGRCSFVDGCWAGTCRSRSLSNKQTDFLSIYL